jgi:hypothetical protein
MSLPPELLSCLGRVALWFYIKLFRADLLSAQPAKRYRAWMVEFKTPFFCGYLINQPELVNTLLKQRPEYLLKLDRVGAGLFHLLGNSLFLTQ